MVQSCVVVGCTSRWRKGSELSWHRFPPKKEETRRRLWLAAVNRKAWEPSSGDRVCGRHFITGCVSFDPSDPDYVPSLHMGYAGGGVDGRSDSLGRQARMERLKSRQVKKMEEEDKLSAAASLLCLSSSVSDLEVPQVAQQSEEEDYFAETESNTMPDAIDYDKGCLSCDEMKLKVQELQARLKRSEAESQQLREQMHSLTFGVSFLKTGNSDFKTKFYTGLPSFALFMWLCSFVHGVFPKFSSVSAPNLLLIVLMKLRLNTQNYDLACRFNVSQTTISDIVNKCIPLLANRIKFLVHWPEKSEIVRHLPSVFRKVYKEARVIIDCTEIFVERPGNFTARAATFSNYKSHNTLKYLVGISPCGSITFISRAYGGRTSDKVVTQRSGFLDMLEYGDVILADRGFLIEEEIASRNCYLVIPSFTRGRVQLSQKDVEISRQISKVRIHVERAIGRLKHFRILSTTMQLVMVPHADSILTICSAVSNLHPKLVK